MTKTPETRHADIPAIKKYAATEIGAAVLLIAAIGYGFYALSSRINSLSQDIAASEARNASTTAELRLNIVQARTELMTALIQEKQNVGAISDKLGTYQNQVGNITDTVTTLQKLSKIDTELLQKYSKVFFLNEYYAPAQLVEVPAAYEYSESKHLKMEAHTEPFLEKMITDAAKDNVTMYVFSAYRSFSEQSALKSQYKVIYGAGTANSFSADQGYSEHQLGTTVDLITPGLGGVLDGFDNTKAYTWLLANAYKYGFTLSYPQDNAYYVFEPWHWRFVGVKLATDLHNSGKHFYDLDQRTIDTYLVSLFD